MLYTTPLASLKQPFSSPSGQKQVVREIRFGRKRKACFDLGGARKKRRLCGAAESQQDEPTQAGRPTNSGTSVQTDKEKFDEKYQEMDQLGKGGFGCVFGGVCKSDGLQVAIKHIPKWKIPTRLKDEDGQWLLPEVAIMLQLNDPDVQSPGKASPVRLLDSYDLDGEVVLVMERPIPATDMLQYLRSKGGRLQEDEAKIIMKQLIRTALDLEERQLFHRDIKLENILIETNGDVPRARLIDYGVSCSTRDRVRFTRLEGTREYASPESLCGSYKSEPTTVWQLGAVAHVALHGCTFKTIVFVVKKWASKNLSKNCIDFLQKCLTITPEVRAKLKDLLQHPWIE